MGIRAERLAGYFSTNASKRAASCGEKIDIDSLTFLVSRAVHQLPRPGFCLEIHLFLMFAGPNASGFCQFHASGLSIVALPLNPSAIPHQLKPAITVAHHNAFF